MESIDVSAMEIADETAYTDPMAAMAMMAMHHILPAEMASGILQSDAVNRFRIFD